jgi:hypothetical protein
MAKKTPKTISTKTKALKAAAKIVAHPAIAELAAEAAAKNAPAAKKAAAPKAEKKARVILNPQHVIDAKTEALKAKGIKLTYAARQWKAGNKVFTSLEFSRYSVQEFADLFPAK